MDAAPRPFPGPDGTASLHATCVARPGPGALLLAGPGGAGKSGLAAQLMAMGWVLVADDLCLLAVEEGRLLARAPGPPDAPLAMELRGLGIVARPRHPPAPVRAMILLGSGGPRLPEPVTTELLGHPVPLLRHPYRFDLAAKLALWADALAPGGGAA